MSFEQEKEKFECYLNKNHVWVLATGSQNEISARSMSIINEGLKIYFQSDIHFEKYRHIFENPNIALCCGNYQVKGTAQIMGSTTDAANTEIMAHYQRVHPSSYERYSRKKDSFLVEIEPRSVQIWDYIENEPVITRINLILKTAEIEKYETWSE